MTAPRKARTDAGESMEAHDPLPDGAGWGEGPALGWDQYRERRSPLGNVLSAALALALVAGVMLLVAIFRVGE